jgi:hypothetical protein
MKSLFRGDHVMKIRVPAVLLLLLASAICVVAQTQSAPIPAPILSAKTVFVANAGSTPSNNQYAILVYNGFYQRLAADKRYLLTSNPAEADLILEVSANSTFEGGQSQSQYVQVVIRDAKTQSLLWSTAEGIQFAARESTLEKNLGDAASKLAADVESLSSVSTAVLPAAPTKGRFADEGKK